MARGKPAVSKTSEEYSEWAWVYEEILEKVIPSLSIATTVIRFVRLALVVTLSLWCAVGGPGVYHDVLVWDKNVTAPFRVTVYRNLTSWTGTHNQECPLSHTAIVNSFVWTRGWEPGCGKYSCDEARYNCSGDKWQSDRIGYGDSLGFGEADHYSNRICTIDHIVVGSIAVIAGVSAGAIAHYLEPNGGFISKLIASIEFIFPLGYFAVGLMPLLWLKGLGLLPGQVKLTSLQLPLHPSHGYGIRIAFALSWLVGVLYIVRVIIYILIFINLQKSAPIAKLPGGGIHQPHQQVRESESQATAVTSISSSGCTGCEPLSSTAVRRGSDGL